MWVRDASHMLWDGGGMCCDGWWLLGYEKNSESK